MDRLLSYNEEYFHRTSKRRAAFVQTYGCQQNVSDSEKIKGMLADMGYSLTDTENGADVVIFNTCAVREHAEMRVFGNVGALKNRKRENPEMIIGLCGCMMQQKHITEKIRQSYPHVDLVFGTHVLHELPFLLWQVISGRKRVFEIPEPENSLLGNSIEEDIPLRRDGGVKAWLPVMYGCNNFCSYCIVPYVRGRERSREPEKILEEAEALVADNCREITLLGQNVNSYGKTLAEKIDFAALLYKLNEINGAFRIRFMTSHPKDATPRLFKAMAECEKVSKHLHLPFQAGSDRILKRMNRGYTKEKYLSLLKQARETVPGLSFSTDIIVGFPGETREDFEETLDVVRQAGFNNIFSFIYSSRKGTPAAEMDDPIPHKEKTKWFAELLELQEGILKARLDKMVGKTYLVLAEGPGKTEDGVLTGRTDGNIIVDFKAPADIVGKFAEVRITRARNFMLVGEMAD